MLGARKDLVHICILLHINDAQRKCDITSRGPDLCSVVCSELKPLLTYETYINHLLFRSDADRRCITLNLSSHRMALQLLRRPKQRAIQAYSGPLSSGKYFSRVDAVKALKSGSVVFSVHLEV